MKEWHVIYSGVPSFSVLDIVYCTRDEALALASNSDEPSADYSTPYDNGFLYHGDDIAGDYSPAFGSVI